VDIAMDTRTLPERVAEQIRELICSGEVSPEAPPRQQELADRFGVSSNYFPLWEANRGKCRMTYEVAQPQLVSKFTRIMDRFSHLRKEELDDLQEAVNSRFEFIKKLTEIS
jgi:hypothetical protein